MSAHPWMTHPEHPLITAQCPERLRRTLARKAPISAADLKTISLVERGSVGVVYLVQDTLSGLIFALKQIDTTKLTELSWSQAEREIEIHSKLDHPNILPLYAAFRDGPFLNLFLEYIPEGDLFAYLAAHGVMREDKAARVLLGLLDGLNYLHLNSIIHRDLKPENLLMKRGGENVKIFDFGLSLRTDVERPVTRLGTQQYMSPEVLHGTLKNNPYDGKDRDDLVYSHKADLWSVGVIAFELLHGQFPFNAKDMSAMAKVIQQPVQIRPLVSEGAANFIRCCLTLDPKERWDSTQLLHHPWILEHRPPGYGDPALRNAKLLALRGGGPNPMVGGTQAAAVGVGVGGQSQSRANPANGNNNASTRTSLDGKHDLSTRRSLSVRFRDAEDGVAGKAESGAQKVVAAEEPSGPRDASGGSTLPTLRLGVSNANQKEGQWIVDKSGPSVPFVLSPTAAFQWKEKEPLSPPLAASSSPSPRHVLETKPQTFLGHVKHFFSKSTGHTDAQTRIQLGPPLSNMDAPSSHAVRHGPKRHSLQLNPTAVHSLYSTGLSRPTGSSIDRSARSLGPNSNRSSSISVGVSSVNPLAVAAASGASSPHGSSLARAAFNNCKSSLMGVQGVNGGAKRSLNETAADSPLSSLVSGTGPTSPFGQAQPNRTLRKTPFYGANNAAVVPSPTAANSSLVQLQPQSLRSNNTRSASIDIRSPMAYIQRTSPAPAPFGAPRASLQGSPSDSNDGVAPKAQAQGINTFNRFVAKSVRLPREPTDL